MPAEIPPPSRPVTSLTVMTCQDNAVLLEVLRAAALGSRRLMPPGLYDAADIKAAMAGGLAFLVAYAGPIQAQSKPVGAVAYRWDHGALRIIHVAVLESTRGTGVARRMVQAVENVAQALGAPRVAASAARRVGEREFLARLGYEAFEPGQRTSMVKALSP
ncbi:MAG: GNAT family N-acetyltransferase [Candidatus Sericytochromatia bacterium]|nr:GNAT family N-acetyltransferase [Candidatus Sericytochromatia bacterium]